MEVYSRPRTHGSFSYIEDDGSGCTNSADRYMRINKAKCENKNSRRECPALADWPTSNDSSTRKFGGFLDVFYCSLSLSISKLFNNEKNLQAEKFIFYY